MSIHILTSSAVGYCGVTIGKVAPRTTGLIQADRWSLLLACRSAAAQCADRDGSTVAAQGTNNKGNTMSLVQQGIQTARNRTPGTIINANKLYPSEAMVMWNSDAHVLSQTWPA
jgi:hypothetical protein